MRISINSVILKFSSYNKSSQAVLCSDPVAGKDAAVFARQQYQCYRFSGAIRTSSIEGSGTRRAAGPLINTCFFPSWGGNDGAWVCKGLSDGMKQTAKSGRDCLFRFFAFSWRKLCLLPPHFRTLNSFCFLFVRYLFDFEKTGWYTVIAALKQRKERFSVFCVLFFGQKYVQKPSPLVR